MSAPSQSELRRDNGPTECPCGAVHPASYRLTGCGHPDCEVVGCHVCLARCGASAACGRFCEDHLEAIDGIKEPACFRCVDESMSDEDEAEFQVIIAAAFDLSVELPGGTA